MKDKSFGGSYLIPFIVSFVAFAVMFVVLDYTIMDLQGLSLIYNP